MELERTAARHWRGTEEQWLGGWLLRAAEGFTGRANSALPLGDPPGSLDDALDAVTRWYRARGLPSMISVPMPLGGALALDTELARRGWGVRPGPAFVMTATSTGRAAETEPETAPPGAELRIDAAMDAEWLRLQEQGRPPRARYDGGSGHRARIGGMGVRGCPPGKHCGSTPKGSSPRVVEQVLTSAPEQAFISFRGGDTAVAVARLSLAGGWAGIASVEVDPAHRRRGLGAAITGACRAEAFARGVNRVFLQVETGNDAARALYERCGFTYSHWYHYRVAPD